ncbi:MAG: hypothetical protein LBL67_03970, partial [Coriobacteriales bacterium]|nr:hypothetical protein [Coriobacteriales bacterium]
MLVLLLAFLPLRFSLPRGFRWLPEAQAAGLPFTISSLSPTVGAVAGGDKVILNGANLPYASTSDYVQDALLAHYDALDNTGKGDTKHSISTSTWKNLESSRFGNATLSNPQWNANSFYATAADERAGTNRYADLSVTPQATKPFTFEWVGYVSGSSHACGHQFMLAQGLSSSGTNWWLGVDDFGANNTVSLDYLDTTSPNPAWQITDIPGIAGIVTGDLIQVAVTWDGSRLHVRLDVNGTVKNASSTLSLTANQLSEIRFMNTVTGQQTVGGMNAFRFYDAVLSSSDLDKNYSVDQKRFLSPPKVKVGGDATDGSGAIATDAVVQSAKTLAFTAPSLAAVNAAGGSYRPGDVLPVYASYNGSGWVQVGEYTYMDATVGSLGFQYSAVGGVSISNISGTGDVWENLSDNIAVIQTSKAINISTDASAGTDQATTNIVTSGTDGKFGTADDGGSVGVHHALSVANGVSATLNVIGDLDCSPAVSAPGINLDTGASLGLDIAGGTTTIANGVGKNSGVHVMAGTTFKVTGAGALSAKSGTSTPAAAIGGMGRQVSGTISIGGSVTVSATNQSSSQAGAAAIGGGQEASGGTTQIIDDASVVAIATTTGQTYTGAGIGSGAQAGTLSCGDILIDTTGTVIALSSSVTQTYDTGAGIGTGMLNGNSNSQGNITIKNGTVLAQGGKMGTSPNSGSYVRGPGAGIGAGGNYNSSAMTYAMNISIEGGTVVAVA